MNKLVFSFYVLVCVQEVTQYGVNVSLFSHLCLIFYMLFRENLVFFGCIHKQQILKCHNAFMIH